jgi:hypothetical protein
MSQVFPEKFTYDEENRELIVDFANGSIVRYSTPDHAFLDSRNGLSPLDPRLAFLNPSNPGRIRDFITWADQRVHAMTCTQAGATGPWMCNCRRAVKSEIIQEATEELSQPQTRPLLAAQQNGVNSQQRTLTYLNTGNTTAQK